jgi:hypothetical protein
MKILYLLLVGTLAKKRRVKQPECIDEDQCEDFECKDEPKFKIYKKKGECKRESEDD